MWMKSLARVMRFWQKGKVENEKLNKPNKDMVERITNGQNPAE
jgi:hypothetical protein